MTRKGEELEATAELTIEDKLRQIASVTARAYLVALQETGILRRACKAAQCSTYMPTYWRRHVEHFAELEQLARRLGEESLIEAAYTRAVDGVARWKFTGKGELIRNPDTDEPYVEYEYSDRLLERLLEAARPELFKTKAVEGDVALNLTVIVEDLRLAEAPVDVTPSAPPASAPEPLPPGARDPNTPNW